MGLGLAAPHAAALVCVHVRVQARPRRAHRALGAHVAIERALQICAVVHRHALLLEELRVAWPREQVAKDLIPHLGLQGPLGHRKARPAAVCVGLQLVARRPLGYRFAIVGPAHRHLRPRHLERSIVLVGLLVLSLRSVRVQIRDVRARDVPEGAVLAAEGALAIRQILGVRQIHLLGLRPRFRRHAGGRPWGRPRPGPRHGCCCCHCRLPRRHPRP
mmetsp:Transcript_37007/g.115884  ORF Transcript_37007/g.115884 Transcript_37007/m.115884 type:complete len:217 (-) Transcript_37007:122-772(-)